MPYKGEGVSSTLIWSKIKSDCLKCGWNTCGRYLSDTELHLWVCLCSVSVPTSCALWLAPGFDELSYFKAAFIHLIQSSSPSHLKKRSLWRKGKISRVSDRRRLQFTSEGTTWKLQALYLLIFFKTFLIPPTSFAFFSELKNGIMLLKPLLTQLTGDH